MWQIGYLLHDVKHFQKSGGCSLPGFSVPGDVPISASGLMLWRVGNILGVLTELFKRALSAHFLEKRVIHFRNKSATENSPPKLNRKKDFFK